MRDIEQLKRKRKRWRSVPKLTDFGEDEARQSVYDDQDGALLAYFLGELRKGVVIYAYDDILQEARMRVDTLSADEKAELLEMIAKEKADKAIRDIIERNFRKVQMDVRGIIDRECSQPQDISPVKDEGIDFRMVDLFA